MAQLLTPAATQNTLFLNHAENLSIIRRMALNLLKTDTTVKAGIAAKRKKAGWDHQYLAVLLESAGN